jgi:small-conductance mechanosensitive channel
MLARFLLASIASVFGAFAAADAVSPPAAPPNLNTTQVAVLSASEVVEILDQTSEWYRTLGLPQQNSLQPSEILILYANRQIADKVVALVVELARADAELLSSEANAARVSADKSASASLDQQRAKIAAERQSIQQEIAANQQKRSSAGRAGKEVESKLAELQGELAMNAARANLLDTMGEFVNQRDPKSADAEALKAHIDAIAASIPSGSSAPTPQTGASPAATAPAAPLNSSVEKPGVRDGIWDLAKNVFDLRAKIKAIEVIDARSKDLADLFSKFSEAPRARLQSYSAGSDALAAAADTATGVALQNLRSQFDTLAWLFKQTSSILLPLSKERVLLQQYRHNLAGWRDTTRRQYTQAWRVLAARLGMVIGLLAAVFVLAEVWRRAVMHYVHEPRRRYQFLLVRTIVMWAVIVAIVGLSFVTEISSFATFAGLITAGVAVAMQSVLVSMVGYFFLIGKYGIRVGDRVQIGNVIGEVMDLGLVRMHLMEFHGEGPLGPTGRVVAFPNLIVFQATGGLFKQLPGVNLAWHEITLPLPAVSDYVALKQRLLEAVRDVTKEYRSEIERQSRELRDMSLSGAGADAEAHVQMHIVDGHMQAVIGYPVHSQHAADIDERVSQAVLAVLSLAK